MGGPKKDEVSYENAQREINGPEQNYRDGVRQVSYEVEQQQQEKIGRRRQGLSMERP